MEEVKYYTPDISEFYIGFECEILGFNPDKRLNKDFKKEWGELIYSLEDFKYLKKENLNTNFRVKYLDKEDIESLGWSYDKTSLKSQWKFFKNNICLFYRPKTNELGTFTIDPSKSDYMLKYSRDSKMISFLTIKNKSELKKLLKQLNIE